MVDLVTNRNCLTVSAATNRGFLERTEQVTQRR